FTLVSIGEDKVHRLRFACCKNKKRPRNETAAQLNFVKRLYLLGLLLFLAEFLVLVLELIDPTGGIDKFGFSGIKGMRGPGNLQLHQRIIHTIYGQGLPGIGRRFCNKHFFIGHILECHQSIVFWVYTFSHRLKCLISEFSSCKFNDFFETSKAIKLKNKKYLYL